MEIFEQIITNVGFPIAVSSFLLVRVEKRLERLEGSLEQLNRTLVAIIEKTSEH